LIKAVVFDIGGVLAYDVWEHLLLDDQRGVARLHDLDPDEVRKAGQVLWKRFAYLTGMREDNWRELEEEYWRLFIEQFHLSTPISEFVQLTEEFIKPVKGMPRLLEDLRSEGIDLAVCSNNTEFWFQRQRRKLDLDQFFDPARVILSNRVGFSKSSSGLEMFQAVVSALQTAKESCLLVDDREPSIRQAVKFGLTALTFPSHCEHGHQYLRALLRQMNVLRRTGTKSSVAA